MTSNNPEDIDTREARLMAYLDGDLSKEDAEALEAEMEADPSLAEELDALASTLETLQGLSSLVAPEAFAENVEGQIRTRSRGRFFDDDFFYRTRIPYEAFAAVMLALLAAIYLFGIPNEPELPAAPETEALGGEPEVPTDKKEAPKAKEEASEPEKAPEKAPDPEEALPKDGAEPDKDPEEATKGPAKAPPREVVPIRRESIIYTLRFTDVNPKARGDKLAMQIRALGSAYKVQKTGLGKLQVEVPTRQIDSFLAGYGKGARVNKMRIHVQQAKAPRTTPVHIRIDKAGARSPALPKGLKR